MNASVQYVSEDIVLSIAKTHGVVQLFLATFS